MSDAKQKFLDSMFAVADDGGYSSNAVDDYWRPQLEAIVPVCRDEELLWELLCMMIEAEHIVGFNGAYALHVAKRLCAPRVPSPRWCNNE